MFDWELYDHTKEDQVMTKTRAESATERQATVDRENEDSLGDETTHDRDHIPADSFKLLQGPPSQGTSGRAVSQLGSSEEAINTLHFDTDLPTSSQVLERREEFQEEHFRQKIAKGSPIATEPTLAVETAESIHKRLLSKPRKLLSQYGVDDPDDLPEALNRKVNSLKREAEFATAEARYSRDLTQEKSDPDSRQQTRG